MRSYVLFFLLFHSLLGQAYCAKLYVSAKGSNVEPYSTWSTAAKTIGAAIMASQKGDEIILAGGTYNEAIRLRRHGLYIHPAKGQRAHIAAPLKDGPKWTDNSAVELDPDAHGTILENLEISGGFYGVTMETMWDWGQEDRGGVSNITIRNCRIHDTGRDCIKVKPNCNDVKILNCEIYRSGQFYGPNDDDRNAEGIDNVNGDRMKVIDCYIHDVATTGVYFKGGATDCLVQGTKVVRAGGMGIMLGFDTSPEYFDLKQNPNMYESINGVVRNCLVIDTVYCGIGLYASKNATVVNNTVLNSAKKGQTPLFFGITLQDWLAEGKRPANTNPVILNNLFFQGSGYDLEMVSIRSMSHEQLGKLSALKGPALIDYNCYFAKGGKVSFVDRRPELNGKDSFEGDISAWCRHMKTDTHSLTTRPRLVDAARRLMTPRPNSPLCNAGKNQQWMKSAKDISGKPRLIGGRVDIGAYEYGGQAVSTPPKQGTNKPPLTKMIMSTTVSPHTRSVFRIRAKSAGMNEDQALRTLIKAVTSGRLNLRRVR